MGTREDATLYPVIIYFSFPDGSTIRSRCTTNREVIEESGMLYRGEGIYDLDERKKLPDSFLDLDTIIFLESEKEIDSRNDLDRFIEPFIKNLW